MDKSENIRQLVTIDSRNSLTLDLVNDVELVTDTDVYIKTGLGGILVKGSGLKLAEFCCDTKKVSILGRIDSVSYTAKREKKSLSKRLFR